MKASQGILNSGLGSERVDHQQNYPEGGAGGEQSSSALLGKESVRRMWEGGPLRQFSSKQAKSHYVGYSTPFLTGYAGSYICDLCQVPCSGVYRVLPLEKWICGGCKERAP
jgi:hypothetical protein